MTTVERSLKFNLAEHEVRVRHWTLDCDEEVTMAGDARTDAGLARLEAETSAFIGDVEELSPEEWARPTNCPPWPVRLLVSHLARGAESYLAAIEAGLRGELRPFGTKEERERRMHEIAAQGVEQVAADFRAMSDAFAAAGRAVGADGVDTLGVHSTGPRTIRWWVDQRLAEVAFHRWDLERSLGRPAALDAATAEYLLPMLLDENFGPIAQRNKPSGDARYRLVQRGVAGAAWTAISSHGFAGISRRSAAPVDATLEGDAAALALLVYGRRTVQELERDGLLSVSGDRGAAERFGEVFGGP